MAPMSVISGLGSRLTGRRAVVVVGLLSFTLVLARVNLDLKLISPFVRHTFFEWGNANLLLI